MPAPGTSNQFSLRLLAVALVLHGLAASAAAQLPQARLYAIAPQGGKAGTTFDVTLSSGADLDEASELRFTHPGITAVSKSATVFAVTVKPDVPSGVYEASARGLFGLSNPRAFVVGSQEELAEKEPNSATDKPNDVPLGRVVNGAIGAATDVDTFRIEGKKGQRVIAVCRASDIDSRLSASLELFSADGRRLAHAREQLRRDPMIDAVLPEDGAYQIHVHDFQYRGGAEYGYRLSLGVGPHLDYVVPSAGVAGTTAKYTLYGRNLPGGQPSGVAIDGKPLDKLEVDIAIPAQVRPAPEHTTAEAVSAGSPSISYVLKSPAGESNPVRIQVAAAAPVVEKEPNDATATAQPLAAPGDFVGQFQSVGDTDYVTFTAKSGQVFTVEVIADRAGSLADPTIAIDQVTKDDKGVEKLTRIVAKDDEATNLSPNVFDTRTDDPSLRFQAPADGTYRVQLRDVSFETRGDPRLTYQLSVRPERPDFELVALSRYPLQGTAAGVSTWAVGLRKGDSRDLELLVIRKDGFGEPIDVSVEGLPAGVTVKGVQISGSAKSAELIFTADEKAADWAGPIRIVGKSKVPVADKLPTLQKADEALKAATEAADKARSAAGLTAEAVQTATNLIAQLKQAAIAAPGDAAIAKSAAAAQALLDASAPAAKSAAERLAAADKTLADSKAAQAKAAAEATRHIAHDAIPGSIVWSAGANIPAVARVAQSVALSVMSEPAPYQVVAKVPEIAANQSQQLLIPVSLVKRNGFDADVALTLAGLPDKFEADIQNKPIPKGKNDEVVRVFLKNNARAGQYALFWKANAAVSYRRNPAAEARAKVEQALAVKAATESAESAKKAVAERDAAAKVFNDATAAQTAAKNRLAADGPAATAANQAAKAATEAKVKAEAAALEPVANAEVTAKLAEFARKSADEIAASAKSVDAAAKSVDAAGKAAAEARVAAANKLAVQSKKAADDAAAAAKAAVAARTDAEAKFAAATAAAKKANDALAASQKAATDADAAFRNATAAKQQKDKLAAELDAKSKAAAAAKTAADQKADAATKVAAAQNINEFALSTPVILTIRPARSAIAAAVPAGGALKKGAKIDVKVTLQRKSDAKGPIKVSLWLPPGVAGLKAEPITIPADKSEGVLSIAAAADAAPGDVPNAVVRADLDPASKVSIDAPVALKITP